MARLAIHVDGAYASKLAENEFRTWFDYEKLSSKIKSNIAVQTQEPLDLVRTYFYDCLPYQSHPPTSDEARRFGNRRKFFHALRQLSNYSVREGRLEYRGEDSEGKPIFQQKRTDLMFGLDMALLAAKHQVTHLALLSGDSDLLPAIEAAKQEGVVVWLVHGPRHTYANDLWTAADNRMVVDRAFANEIARKR